MTSLCYEVPQSLGLLRAAYLRDSSYADFRKIEPKRNFMPGADRLAEINDQIAAIRQNLRELIERAAAQSGAADENLAADRISAQEAQLSALVAERDSLQTS